MEVVGCVHHVLATAGLFAGLLVQRVARGGGTWAGVIASQRLWLTGPSRGLQTAWISLVSAMQLAAWQAEAVDDDIQC